MKGRCLRAGVRYEVHGPLDQPLACHCSQCARTSGNFAVMARCKSTDLSLLCDDTLGWFRSSDKVERGFCRRCGGNLFWRMAPGDDINVTAGTLDQPTGLQIAAHIFVGSKSDFYALTDGLPQKEEW
ncbi:GFA family protein [Xanthobacter sediminis]